MLPEDTKRFDAHDPDPDTGATRLFDTPEPQPEGTPTKQLPQVDDVIDDSGDTRALAPVDSGSTQLLGDVNGASNGMAVVKSLAPKRLRVIMPDQSELVFDDLRPHLVVGRKSSANTRHIDIDLSKIDTGVFGVSRIHAMIIPDDRLGLIIKDLQSVNGTYINGRKLRENTDYPLAPGDYVKFGNLKVQLLFELGK